MTYFKELTDSEDELFDKLTSAIYRLLIYYDKDRYSFDDIECFKEYGCSFYELELIKEMACVNSYIKNVLCYHNIMIVEKIINFSKFKHKPEPLYAPSLSLRWIHKLHKDSIKPSFFKSDFSNNKHKKYIDFILNIVKHNNPKFT